MERSQQERLQRWQRKLVRQVKAIQGAPVRRTTGGRPPRSTPARCSMAQQDVSTHQQDSAHCLQLLRLRNDNVGVIHSSWAQRDSMQGQPLTRPGTILSSSVPMFTASWSATSALGLQHEVDKAESMSTGQQTCTASLARQKKPVGTQLCLQQQQPHAPDALGEAAAALLVDGVIQEAAILGVLHRLEHQAAQGGWEERRRSSKRGSRGSVDVSSCRRPA